jgi:hypothetical protein
LKHYASPEFWRLYRGLPREIQIAADKSFALLKENARHPSIHLKRVGNFWSARVGLQYRALGVSEDDGISWFWIGSHADYDQLLR